MTNFSITTASKQLAIFTSLAFVATGCVSATETKSAEPAASNAAANSTVTEHPKPPVTNTTLQRLYRGKTLCTQADGKSCGTDYWTMFLHKDGSRVMQVTSETSRASEVRHATIVIEKDGIVREAFLHNRAAKEALGSSYVVQTDKGIDQAIHNSKGLKTPTDGIKLSSVASENAPKDRSIGTGPAASDGLHFLNYDVEKAGDQPKEVFWLGGSYGGTMAGGFRNTKYTYLGEVSIDMPQGYAIKTDHFRMGGGSEVWLSQGSRFVVRADVRFGKAPVLSYKLMELDVSVTGAE